MQGLSDSKITNKTEFMRYLDEHPDAVPSLAKRYKEYKINFARGSKFGGWMRQKYLSDFSYFYLRWWMTHPELFDKVYSPSERQQSPLSV